VRTQYTRRAPGVLDGHATPPQRPRPHKESTRAATATMDHGPPGGYYPDAKRQRTAKPDHAFSKQQSGYEFQQHKMNAAVAAQGGRQKPPASKVAIRRAGGKTWRDDTLEQWPEGDFRLFVGNIGNEVTDELLSHSFGRYPSLARAKVIRNKHTNKSKGYAFISFMDPFDCAKALREMSGKYIGNRPCKLQKSTWNERTLSEVRKKDKKKRKAQKQWGISA
jgi:hypothetical protein